MATAAFAYNPALQARVNGQLQSRNFTLTALLTDVKDHVLDLQSRISSLTSEVESLKVAATTNKPPDVTGKTETSSEPASKKRKLPTHGGLSGEGDARPLWHQATPLLTARDVSFSLPMRKKLALEIVGENEGGLRVVDSGKGEVEAGMAWSDIDQVFALPVPEKATASTNFVVIPRRLYAPAPTPESLVWTVPTQGTSKDWSPASAVSYVDTLTENINSCLRPYSRRLITPQPTEFVSNVVQAHRKGEKNWHVKAWHGSKEGYLFLLSTGILFAFKKPLLYYPFADIASVSYTSVLQRTFNLVITTARKDSQDGGLLQDEIEFAMLDQTDFAPLDAYVKKHGLHDASLAAARRAKHDSRENPNPKKEIGVAGQEQEEIDEEGELAKAERELQDREDEEEEDFEVGSGSGESDGSGSEQDSDEDNEGGQEQDDNGEDEADGYELDEDDEVVAHDGEALRDQGRAKRQK